MKTLFPERDNLNSIINSISPDLILILSDENVKKLVLQQIIENNPILYDKPLCIIKSGEGNKSLTSLQKIWDFMINNGATRKSLLINIGGGVISDIGGFAAATFKRGMKYINISTTLLGATDASAGGKTGVNFRNVKNAIGAFANPEAAFFYTDALKSLPYEQLISGYAEIVKTAFLMSAEEINEVYRIDENLNNPFKISDIVSECIKFKLSIVDKDLNEHNIRKVLNFGHTAGHAFESLTLSQGNSIAHGIAVAHGILVALILSHLQLNLDSQVIQDYSEFLKLHYPRLSFNCEDYGSLVEFMRQDKKNTCSESINFTLLKSIGHPIIDYKSDINKIKVALDIYRDIMGI